jgi:hypothetical protein
MNGANSDGAIEQRPEVTAPAWHRSDIEFAVGENNEQCSGWLYTPVHKRCAVKTRVWSLRRSGGHLNHRLRACISRELASATALPNRAKSGRGDHSSLCRRSLCGVTAVTWRVAARNAQQ